MDWMKKIFALVFAAAILYGGWHEWGLVGLVGAAGGLVMFLLLHFSRMMRVLQRAGQRPVGYFESAVMLNARLKKGVTLLHVMAMTRSIGQARSPEGQQPEIFRWTDPGGSYVDCEFQAGKLAGWTLWRPPQEEDAPPAIEGGAPEPAPPATDAQARQGNPS